MNTNAPVLVSIANRTIGRTVSDCDALAIGFSEKIYENALATARGLRVHLRSFAFHSSFGR
jgi:hypothetical protein